MGLFNRKKQEATIPQIISGAPPHEHTWKDFPWYMRVQWDGTQRTASYKIYEPYVCITCGKRQDKLLEQQSCSNIGSKEREKMFADVETKYAKYLQPIAVVEDMINDVLLVKDRAHLEMVEKMLDIPHPSVGTSTSKKPDKFKIEVEK